jgi:hypothetical protein
MGIALHSARRLHALCRVFPAQLLGTRYAIRIRQERVAELEPLTSNGKRFK